MNILWFLKIFNLSKYWFPDFKQIIFIMKSYFNLIFY